MNVRMLSRRPVAIFQSSNANALKKLLALTVAMALIPIAFPEQLLNKAKANNLETACVIGSSTANCQAYSPQEVYLLYGTQVDAATYLSVSGISRRVWVKYSRTNTDNGGWILLMKGRKESADFTYNSQYFTNSSYTNNSDSMVDDVTSDAKSIAYNSLSVKKLLAVFKDYAGGVSPSGVNGGSSGTLSASGTGDINPNGFSGHVWLETLGSTATAYNTLNVTNGTTITNGAYTGTRYSIYRESNSASAARVFTYQDGYARYGFNINACKVIRWGVSWNNESDFGSCDTHMGIGVDTHGTGDWATWNGVSAATTSTGITGGSRNGMGFQIWGKMSDPSLASPTGLTVSDRGAGSALVSWSKPTSFNPTEYLLQYRVSGQSWSNSTVHRVTTPTTTPSVTLTGLSNGQYDFQVFARDNATSQTSSSPVALSSVSIDTTAPTVTNVTSSTTNGSYTVGTTIPIQVTFSEAVTVTGTPQLTLATGGSNRTINYSSGTGSTTLTFNYAIQAGDTTSDLNYTSTSALTLNSGTIRDAAGNNATLTLPGLTSAGSLGVNKALVIDTTAPTLLSATLLSNGTQLRAIFSESLTTTTAPASAFSINDSGTSVTPSAISVTDTSTVTLTVASAIRAGRTITFSYTDPTAGNDTNAVHDMAGNDVASFTNQPVTNNSTVLNPLTTPTTLAVSAIETNTATFTYTPTTNASSHTLRLYDSATTTLLSTTTSFASGSSLTSLTPATRYYATLQAVGNGTVFESSTASSPVYFTTAIRKPVISSQPIDTTTTVLGSATFRVSASSADSGALSYQWQQSTNAGVTYVDLPSANLATLTLTTPTLSQSGERYRVIVTAIKNGVSASETSSVAILTVTKASQSAITITSTTVTYGETLTLTTSGGTGSGALTFTKNSGSCTIAGTTLTPSSQGSCSVTATKASDATYLEESTTATITINTRPITIKASDRTATYTGSSVLVTNTFSITSGTLTLGESITSLTYTYTSLGGYNSPTAPTTAGNYTITPSAAVFSPGSSSNYAITYDTATLTVNRASQATLTITTTSVAFGSTLTLDTDGGSGSGNVTYAVSSGSCTISSSTLTPTAVGSCTITATKALDTNYLAATSAATLITISQGLPSATLTFSSTTLTFGITNTLTITASVAGTVRYSANGKVIKSCRARPTSLSSPFVATCSYRPATRRPTTITATLTPTDLGFASRTTTSSTFLVARRTGARG